VQTNQGNLSFGAPQVVAVTGNKVSFAKVTA
jgi:hypothetical protein